MSPTRDQRLTAFLETLAECTIDERGYPMTQPAQAYIQEILSTRARNDQPSMLAEFAEKVAAHLTNKTHDTPRCFGSVLKSLPDTQTGKLASHALDKVALKVGLRGPHSAEYAPIHR